MDEISKMFKDGLEPGTPAWRLWLQTVSAVFFILLFVALIGGGVLSAYAMRYQGRVYPGTMLGNYSVGGLSGSEVKNLVESINNRYAREGIDLDVRDRNGTVHLVRLMTVTTGDNSTELIRLESDITRDRLLSVGRTGPWWKNIIAPFVIRFLRPVSVRAIITVNDAPLRLALKNLLSAYEDEPHNATVNFTPGSFVAYQIVPEQSGKIFNFDTIIAELKTAVGGLSFSPVSFSVQTFSATVSAADVSSITPRLSSMYNYGSLGINFIDPQTKVRHDWTIPPVVLASWTEVSRDHDGNLVFSLDHDATVDYLNSEVGSYINTPALDAKFVAENGKVKEFQASRSGAAFSVEDTYRALNDAFVERNFSPSAPVATVSAIVDTVEPKLKTADVNSLGIVDVIGTGISTFKDSHTNRIKNIGVAVNRLNGVLIKPDEEFSTLKYLRPLDETGGFLPELVIKGQEIKPEVGGGLCQIGTTLFRMAMNSGMDISERRNHSLVVSYYLDPVNHNPGTDATIYDPAPDFRFKNDTGNYLLLQTNIDYNRQQLTFTLWGKPDGRKGWYSHPTVSKWIPAGTDTETIEVDDGSVPLGKTKCQDAFKGAVASFTYSRVTPAGDKIDRIFDSYYRPLPKICMVGVTKKTCPAGQNCPAPSISASSTPTLDVGESQ